MSTCWTFYNRSQQTGSVDSASSTRVNVDQSMGKHFKMELELNQHRANVTTTTTTAAATSAATTGQEGKMLLVRTDKSFIFQ